MKNGIYTTEFWLALIVVLLGAIASVYSSAQWAQVAGLVSGALAAAGYGWSRASVKKAGPKFKQGGGALGMLLMPLLLAGACVGNQARENVSLPAMKLSWTAIAANVAAGNPTDAETAEAAALGSALDRGDRLAVARADWPMIKIAAERGIDARLAAEEIGPTVASLFRERVRLFGVAHAQLQPMVTR